MCDWDWVSQEKSRKRWWWKSLASSSLLNVSRPLLKRTFDAKARLVGPVGPLLRNNDTNRCDCCDAPELIRFADGEIIAYANANANESSTQPICLYFMSQVTVSLYAVHLSMRPPVAHSTSLTLCSFQIKINGNHISKRLNPNRISKIPWLQKRLIVNTSRRYIFFWKI